MLIGGEHGHVTARARVAGSLRVAKDGLDLRDYACALSCRVQVCVAQICREARGIVERLGDLELCVGRVVVEMTNVRSGSAP